MHFPVAINVSAEKLRYGWSLTVRIDRTGAFFIVIFGSRTDKRNAAADSDCTPEEIKIAIIRTVAKESLRGGMNVLIKIGLTHDGAKPALERVARKVWLSHDRHVVVDANGRAELRPLRSYA